MPHSKVFEYVEKINQIFSEAKNQGINIYVAVEGTAKEATEATASGAFHGTTIIIYSK